MNRFFRRSWAEINLDNLAHNYKVIKGLLPPSCGIMAVVKADAYGHGADYIAGELESLGTDMFAVSNLEEAISLRRAGVSGGILILGPTPAEYAAVIAENKIQQTVNSLEYAKELNSQAQKAGVIINIHIKLDTGMGRIGFSAQGDIDEICREIGKMEALAPTGVFSHLSHADCAATDAVAFTEKQAALFNSCVTSVKRFFPNVKAHLQNSAGIIGFPTFSLDYARPGIILYGLDPSDEMSVYANIKPVMELKSTIIEIKQVKAGTPIGYGRKYIAQKDMTVATVPIGYADGYSRLLSNKGVMLVRGQRAKVIGNVCMDMLMLDITGIDDAQVNDTVTVYGADGDEFYGAADAAAAIGTISYELVCLVSKRVPRIYLKGGEIIDVCDLLLK